jgi:hypothetical protein
MLNIQPSQNAETFQPKLIFNIRFSHILQLYLLRICSHTQDIAIRVTHPP